MRVASVWALAGGVGFIVLSILTFPIYILVTLQLENHTDVLTIATAESEEFVELESILHDANQQARLIIAQKPAMTLTAHIQTINSLAGQGIIMNSFQLDVNDKERKIIISGIADSRLLLANFRDGLEQNENYNQVELPLSALIKDQDIDFRMTLSISENNNL